MHLHVLTCQETVNWNTGIIQIFMVFNIFVNKYIPLYVLILFAKLCIKQLCKQFVWLCRQVCDRPLAVLFAQWPDSRHDRLHLHTLPSVLLCWGKTVGLQSESPNTQLSCRKDRQTIHCISFYRYPFIAHFILQTLINMHWWCLNTGSIYS